MIINMICLILARYNIPPIRAVDFTTHRDQHPAIVSPSPSYSSPPAIDPIGHRRNPKSQSGTIQPFLLVLPAHSGFFFSSDIGIHYIHRPFH